jgi:hypothetical protein
MRLVKVKVTKGMGTQIKATAFKVGVETVSIYPLLNYSRNGEVEEQEAVDIETSTPKAKAFVDELLAADYYKGDSVTFNIRQPRTIGSNQDIRELTTPLAEPPTDLFQELWQFSRVTYGLLGRVLIAAALIAYGLINAKILLLIGGLLFLPVLPLIMAISYGIVGRQWRLAAEGAFALACTTVVLYAGGAAMGFLSQPPPRSDDTGTSFFVGVLFSVAVGVAAALASIDDAGRREMIGLAAAGQIGLIPVWLGIVTVLGLPVDAPSGEAVMRALSFLANLAALTITIMIMQLATGVVGNISRMRTEKF